MSIKKYILPVVVGILVLVFGLLVSNHFDLYNQFAILDKVYHVLGGVVLGWFFYKYFSSGKTQLSTFNFVLVVIASVCLFGVIWEFAERLSSVYSTPYFPWLYKWFHGGDLNDTLIDLVADMTGGLAFVLASLFTKGK